GLNGIAAPCHAPTCFQELSALPPNAVGSAGQNYSGSSPLALITAAASCVVKNLTSASADLESLSWGPIENLVNDWRSGGNIPPTSPPPYARPPLTCLNPIPPSPSPT